MITRGIETEKNRERIMSPSETDKKNQAQAVAGEVDTIPELGETQMSRVKETGK